MKHRDLAKIDWTKREATLVERYAPDSLVCTYHQRDWACLHTDFDHSRAHEMDECPFRASRTILLASNDNFRVFSA